MLLHEDKRRVYILTEELSAMKEKTKDHKRESLRQKYRDEGISSLSESELLQLLLSYSGSGDPEEAAKSLINEYGSVDSLCSADSRLLMKNKMVNERSAVLLKLIPCVSRILSQERFAIKTLSDTAAAKNYFSSHFIGAIGEQLIITAVGKRLRIAETRVLAFGTPSQAGTSYREIAGFAVQSSCEQFFIAHNHPFGAPQPSDSDILFTRNVINALSKLGAVLIDHIIVGADESASLRELGCVPELSASPACGYKIGSGK